MTKEKLEEYLSNLNLNYYTEEELELIPIAEKALNSIHDKHLESNKRTAEYIAKRRVEDKNYARSKK